MDFRKLLAVVLRYWVAVLGVLVLTAVAIVLVPSHIAPDYDARGTAILLSPSTTIDSSTGEGVGINPWSRFGSSGEGVAATAIIEVLQSKAVEDVVLDDDAVQEYSVTLNPGGNGAILDVSVLASDDEAAIAAFDLIMERLTVELESRQEAAGAPPDTWLEAKVLTRPDESLELQGSRTRAMLAVGVLGLIAAVAVAVGLDALLSGRRDRTSENSSADTDATDDEDSESAGRGPTWGVPAQAGADRPGQELRPLPANGAPVVTPPAKVGQDGES